MKYLIATDGSANAKACVDYLSNYKLADNDLIKVITICDSTPFAVIPARLHKEEAEMVLTNTVEALKHILGEQVSGNCIRGEVAATIVQVGRTWGADKIFVGAHARSELPEILIGNIAKEVLERSEKSVVILRAIENKNIEKSAQKILWCIDAIPLTESALLRLPNATELKIFHVLHPEGMSAEKTQGLQYDHNVDDDKLALRANKQKFIDEQINKISRIRPDIISGAVITEDTNAVASILRYSTDWQTDLIIMEAHKYTASERMFVGSVSQKVAHLAKCSVEVIR